MNMNDAFVGSLIFNKNSGGSGSGGHTIVDSEGTSLEQRTNLQFNGAYSEDNSTDDTTEIDVVREMTKAEFDELTEAEKTGLINITDITGGNDDRFQPVIYSEDEREIGVYTDGKPLYQKTIIFPSAITIPVETWTTVATVTNLDIDSLAYCFGNGTVMTQIASVNAMVKAEGNNKVLQVFLVFAWSIRTVTLQYTKTTDTAGSGQWTPQGVPAHHYSEDEQIVGTWIDGSTIYEKTFDLSSVSLPNATWTNNVLGTSSSNIKIRKFSGIFNTSGGSYINEPFADYNYCRGTTEFFTAVINDAGNDLNLRPQIDGVTMTAGVCTIQYTKSST